MNRTTTHLISRFKIPFLAKKTFNFQMTLFLSPKLPFQPREGMIPSSSPGQLQVLRSGIRSVIGIGTTPD
jgi:hypothetical protein